MVKEKKYMSKGARTRSTILQVAFSLTYTNGFQATSIDEILKKTNVTKGSFFHHFKSKEAMGLAMINEILYPGMRMAMIDPLVDSKKPIEEIYNMMHGLLMINPTFDVKYGCPAVNLIEEMASVSETFNTALLKLSNEWKMALVNCLSNAQKNGEISNEHNVEHIALFIISGYGGIRNLGKLHGKACYGSFLKEFKAYLDRL